MAGRICRILEARLLEEFPDNKVTVIPTNWSWDLYKDYSWYVGSLGEEAMTKVRQLTTWAVEEAKKNCPDWVFWSSS